MRTVQWILLAITSLALVACTDGNPSLSSLSSIDGITFSTEKKSSEVYKISTSPSCTSDLTVTGHCDQRFNQLQFSIDGEATWNSITGYNTNSNGDCSDGEFKLYFPNACSAFNVSDGSDAVKKILIRADQKISQNTTREATVNFTSEMIVQLPIASIDNAPLTEGSTLTFTVSLSKPSVGMSTVQYSFSNITTTNDDFATAPATTGFVTFTDGQQTAVINYVTAPDTKDEDDQTFNVTLTNATGATLSTTNYIGVGTIIDDDSPPTITLTQTSPPILESVSTATLTATLSTESEKPITVTFDTADDSAVAPEDYIAVTAATMTIAPGALSANKLVTIVNDTIDEPKQCFTSTISAPTNATITTANAQTCITDDDAEPTVSIADASATEGTNLSFAVTLSAASQQTFSINYAVTNGTTSTADFTAYTPSGTLNFAVNSTSIPLMIATDDDALIEGNETFTITLSGPVNTFNVLFKTGNITIADGTATGTIVDNEVYAAPTLSLVSPTSSPGTSSRPSLRASGLDSGDVVKIFTNNTCSTQILSFTATGSTMDFTLSASLSAGSHNFYSTRENGVSTSACAATALAYSYTVPIIAPVYQINGGNWNDYIAYSNSGKTIYTQADSACVGNESGHTDRLLGCIHGGEKRKVEMAGFLSCTGLTAADALGAFDWECKTANSSVYMFSKGLKAGKGLRDLIDGSTLMWRTNSVTVSNAGVNITTTPSTTWWSNSISDLSGTLDNSSTTTVKNLSDAGKIYLINGDQTTFGYNITADKVSVVTMGTSVLRKYDPINSFNCTRSLGTWSNSASDNVDTVLCAGNRKYLWIEARLNGISTYLADAGIFMTNTNRSQFRNTMIYDLNHGLVVPALELYNSNANVLSGLTLHNTSSGILLQTSSHNTIRNLNISHVFGPSNGSPSGIEINGASAEDNRFYNVRISNFGYDSFDAQAIYIRGPRNIFSKINISNVLGNGSTYGIRFGAYTSNENILSQIIVAGTTDTGLYFDGQTEKNVISNATIVNNSKAIYFYGVSGIPKNNNISSAVIHNSDYALSNDASIPSGSHGNQFSDLLFSNTQSYGVSFQESGFAIGSGFLLFTDTCGQNYGATFCTGMGAASVSNLGSFGLIGPISVDDTANPDDSLGSSTFGGLTMDGMLKFESWTRGWGKDYGLASYSSIGSSSGSIHIWDMAPVAGGRLIDRSGTGISTNDGLVLDSASMCGSNTVNTGNMLFYNGTAYFKNAIEFDGDSVGNDNELCEVGEDCAYAPNIGAVQPDGVRSAGYCIITTGTRLFIRN